MYLLFYSWMITMMAADPKTRRYDVATQQIERDAFSN